MPGTRFSIVITCYNQRDLIRAAVDSALAQQHPLKEIIVVDDGSTDGSPDILEQYGDSIRLVKLPANVGGLEARNRCAALARGEYLVFLDGDDLFMPWAVDIYERIIAQRRPKIILAERKWFEGAVPPLNNEDVPHKIEFVEYGNLMAKDRSVGSSFSTFVVDREVFQAAGGISLDVPYLDVMDLSAKLGYSGPTILICSPMTVFYRIHASNTIHNVPPILRMCYRVMEKEKAGQYPGGPEHRFERYAWLGGVISFWVKRALRTGLYGEGLRVGVKAWLMILCAVVRRLAVRIKGRRPVETIDLVLR